MRLPRVYPIVDSAAWVQRLAPRGVRLLQLRIKNQPAAHVAAEIAAARVLSRAAGMQLVINDYWQQALDLGCDFVHL
ncbi:MAG TPA: thiamine phosphate synthase, partial [Steroidobacteraceae bacterium]